jgi:hypothetical protein
MSSIMKILRRIGGVKAPPTAGTAGELALWKADTTPYSRFELFAHDGAQWFPITPDVLLAARTYYVATTGLDTNDGLTAAKPFKTIQQAFKAVEAVDMNGFDITVQLADGTYAENAKLTGPTQGYVNLVGNEVNPSAVYLAPAAGIALVLTGFANLRVKGVFIKTTAVGVRVSSNSTLLVNGHVTVDTGSASATAFNVTSSSTFFIDGVFNVNSSMNSIAAASYNSSLIVNKGATINLKPGISFTDGMFRSFSMSSIAASTNFTVSGSYTGPAYTLQSGSAIDLGTHPYTIFGGSLPPNHPDNAPIHADEGSY